MTTFPGIAGQIEDLIGIELTIWKIALPPAPWDVLMTLTGTYAALYMGGHTVLRAIGKAGDK